MTRQWNSEIESWARSYILSQEWRIRPLYDVEDMMIEARLVFNRCVEKYPDVSEKHFKALMRRGILNEITWCATRRTRIYGTEQPASAFSSDFPLHNFSKGDSTHEAEVELRLLIQEDPILAKLAELLVTPREVGNRLPRQRRSESRNEFLCRLCGFGGLGIDLLAYVNEHLVGINKPIEEYA